MQLIDAEKVRARLDWPGLLTALETMFRQGCTMPVRHHHTVNVPGEADATLLLMPAWQSGAYIGVKIVNVMPGNALRGLPAVAASYLLADGRTGQMLALIDGGELTARRTAAASALAASYLARADAAHLLMVGTGRLAPNLIAAHASVRPLRQVTIWGRDPTKAAALAAAVRQTGLAAQATDALAEAAAQADIISCATLSTTPLLCGDWLRPGVHVDLVGGFRPDMREADDTAIRRASVFVDTRAGASQEAGDIVQPLASGVLAETAIVADLYALCRGEHNGRRSAEEITLFKSVGAALEDLAAAIRVLTAA